MKQVLKKVLLIVFFMVILNTSVYAEEPTIKVSINGNNLIMDTTPFIQNGRTLVPLRSIFEALGANVIWNGETRTVTATKGDKIITLVIDNNIAKVDGIDVILDVPAIITNNRTMVPARFIAESLGAKVNWDNQTNTVIIYLANATAQPITVIEDIPLAVVVKDGKYGYVDEKGNIVIELKYDGALYFSEGLAAVKVDGKFGYIDKNGNTVIANKYDVADHFSEGLACVSLNGKWGFIDKNGNVVVEIIYDEAYSFTEGLARIMLNDRWGVIDSKGDIVVQPQYDLISYYSEGLATVLINGKNGVIDKTGAFVIQPIYTDVLPFSEGLAFFLSGYFQDLKSDNKDVIGIGLIDKTGKVVFMNRINYSGIISGPALVPMDNCKESLIKALSEEGKFGFLDKRGNVAIRAKYDEVGSFSESLAAIKLDGKWGFIDTSGNIAVETEFDWVSDFSQGLCRIVIDGKQGFIDKKGNIVIEPKFDAADDFTK